MLKWNSAAAKVIVTFSLVVLGAVAATEAILLALVLSHSSEEASRPETASQPQKASAEQTSALPPVSVENWAFHGGGLHGATHIPFRLSNGVIIINAHINGKPMDCVVDTGCPIVFWASWLHLTDQRTGLEASIGDAGSHTAHAQEAILDTVQIGGLKLHNLPSYAVAASRQSSAYLTLGNVLFAHTVLTIDYAKRELIIQPSVPNTVPAGVQDYRHTLNFRWFNPDERGEAGVPCVRGTVMLKPVNMTIDTGWYGGSIGITNRFYHQLRTQIRAGRVKVHEKAMNVVFGTTGTMAISRVSWSLGDITQASPALTVNTLAPEEQAVFSPYLLKGYRTTIDYPQQKIWLDPILAHAKPTAQAKQHAVIPQKA